MNATYSLNGPWTLHRDATGTSYPAIVPGDVYSDLIDAEVIDRPFFRDNERRYQWVSEEKWIYRREFSVPDTILEKSVQRIVFEGLDTFASINLNGVCLGTTENMFRRYEYDVTGLLRLDGNILRIVFDSPVNKARSIGEQLSFKIPYTGEAEWVATHTCRNLIRKCQCQAGWDWGPAFLTSGVWKDVSLVGFDAARIRRVKTVQFHNGGKVTVKAFVQLDLASPGTYTLSMEIGGKTIVKEFSLDPGNSEAMTELTLNQPALWWPRGYGDQNLHSLRITLHHEQTLIDEQTLRVGFRQIELVQEPDEFGEAFYFRINGVPIFLKGYNWIPASIFPSRLKRDDYSTLLQDAALAHCNLLRVWGGGIYEHSDFYDLCDELGLLVWQDFMFACAMYPWDDAFLANVSEEAIDQIWRLSPHPSLLMWCGNNECEQALDWYPESRVHRDQFLTGYHKLFIDTLGRIAHNESPDRPYWPSSPTNGSGIYGDPNDSTRGDVHYWEVWHGGKRFQSYLSVLPRMSTEYGFQSVPSLDTLEAAMEPSDLNISSSMMDYHQRSAIGNRAMVEHMMYEYRLPTSFKDFVYLSQVQQAMAMKVATEHWRRIKPRNMGTIIWQLNDIWPGNSWSALEYGGKWKVLHSFAQRFFAPVLFSLVKSSSAVEVWATSDRPYLVQGSFALQVHSFDGIVLRSWNESFALNAQESRQLLLLEHHTLIPKEDPNHVFLVLHGTDGSEISINWEFLVPAKHCPLSDAQVEVELRATGAQTEITLRTDRPIFHVWLDPIGRHGIFDDNGFILLPDTPKVVRFTPRDGSGLLKEEELSYTHLAKTQR